jgi:hypothetical protein
MMSMDRSNGYMPRKARASVGDILFIINRGNAQIDAFHEDICRGGFLTWQLSLV